MSLEASRVTFGYGGRKKQMILQDISLSLSPGERLGSVSYTHLDVYKRQKKGRPGHVLTVLCSPDKEKELAQQILKQTTTNGLRVRHCGKYFLHPGSRLVESQWGPVRIKTAQGCGIEHEKPEYEDVARLAREQGLSYQTVLNDVLHKM